MCIRDRGIPRLRTLLTRLHLPDDKSRPQHPHYPHIPENALRIGSHFASRPAFQDRAMPFFVVHDTHQGLPAMGILFQFGQPAVDFAQGALVPLKVQKVFCHCIHICGVIPPKASGAAEWRASQSPNPQKICRNSVRTPAGRRFTSTEGVEKKSIPALLRVLQEYPSSRFFNPSKSIFHGINDARNCIGKGARQQIRAYTLI